MIATLRTGSIESQNNLRAIDPRQDMNQVADLVELCFADTLDTEGKDYIKQIRRAANNPAYVHLAGALGDRSPMPLAGFVWEENKRIVGNLTMIPYYPYGKHYYLIANVAVHPNFRRNGIARSLTNRAIEQARNRKADMVWLHVREENQAAYHLYKTLGFKENARRTTWMIQNNNHEVQHGQIPSLSSANHDTLIRSRKNVDWTLQKKWLEWAYPAELTWQLPINYRSIQPGLSGMLYRYFFENQVKQWSVRNGSNLLGVVSWVRTHQYTDNLWLAIPPDAEKQPVTRLLSLIFCKLPHQKPISLDYPAGRVVEALQEVGFVAHQTLVWMSLPLD
jgi:ribosomal protein S18 acetylase RimI-like enzyme